MSNVSTRVRLNDGRYGTIKHLFGGNGEGNVAPATIQVGDKDVRDFLREAKKANFKKNVDLGKSLMLEATKAIGAKNLAGALKAMWKNRYACACYLADEASKRERRFAPIDKGFHELELMENFLEDRIKAAGGEVPAKFKGHSNNGGLNGAKRK